MVEVFKTIVKINAIDSTLLEFTTRTFCFLRGASNHKISQWNKMLQSSINGWCHFIDNLSDNLFQKGKETILYKYNNKRSAVAPEGITEANYFLSTCLELSFSCIVHPKNKKSKDVFGFFCFFCFMMQFVQCF